MKKPYHYTQCGLDYIYLMDGYTIHETECGEGISIENMKELYNFIADEIVSFPVCFRGQEVRFIRSVLDLTQHQIAKILGVTRDTIAKYEKERNKVIPKTQDGLLRYIYRDMTGSQKLKQILDIINERDCEEVRKEMSLAKGNNLWHLDNRAA